MVVRSRYVHLADISCKSGLANARASELVTGDAATDVRDMAINSETRESRDATSGIINQQQQQQQ